MLRPHRWLLAALGAAALLLGSVAPAVAGTPPGKSKVAWIEDPDGPYGAVMTQNGDGTGLRELLPGLGYGSVQWAPGGHRLVVERVDGSIAIYTADGTFVRAVANGTAPSWSPDGRSLAYASGMAVYRVPAVGGVPRRLTRLPCVGGDSVVVDWSPRGGRLLITAYCPNSSSQAVTWTYSLATDKLVRRFGGVPWPRWMPDGRPVVFTSQCAGADGQGPCIEHQFNVYVADVNGRHRVAQTDLPGCADDAPCMDGYSQVAPAPSGRDFAVTYTRASDGAGCIRALHGRWKHCVEWRYPNSPSWVSAR